MLLSAVSAPTLSSVPGRLLLIVAGRQTIGMLKAGKLSRSSTKLQRRLVAGPAADHQQCASILLLFDRARNRIEVTSAAAPCGSCPIPNHPSAPSRRRPSSPARESGCRSALESCAARPAICALVRRQAAPPRAPPCSCPAPARSRSESARRSRRWPGLGRMGQRTHQRAQNAKRCLR